MKRFVFLLFVFALASCSKEVQVKTDLAGSRENSDSAMLTKADILGVEDFAVTRTDVDLYLQMKRLAQKGNLDVKDVTGYPEGDSPLCYVVNYGDGWEILSGDRRTPPVLAADLTGRYSLPDENENRQAWITSVLQEIEVLRTVDMSSLGDKSLSEMSGNYAFWDIMSDPGKYIDLQTKAVNPGGHYVVAEVTTDTTLISEVPHLMVTHWHQESPYNQYCPFGIIYSTERSLAGCVPLAVSQVLFYLHSSLGVPVYAPDQIEFSGSIYNPLYNPYGYVLNPSGSSSSVWNSMLDSNGSAAAILISDICNKVQVVFDEPRPYVIPGYGVVPGGTGAFMSYIPYTFNTYGISCSDSTAFNASVVSNYLSGNSTPTIIGAHSSTNASGPDSGHCFVIDGYRYGSVTYTYRYVWVVDEPGSPMQMDYYDVVYTSPCLNAFYMNWGWGPAEDNGWYSTTGDWTINSNNYNVDRWMINGFSIIGQ